MKLYNKTRVPDAVLEAVLTKAGRAVGARTGKVIVKVTVARNMGVSGRAECVLWARKWWLDGTKAVTNGRKVSTDGGMFTITLPRPRKEAAADEALAVAQSFFKIACHEWVHVRDFQTEKDSRGRIVLGWSSRGNRPRRPNWKNRPEEQRAEFACADALLRGRDVEWAAEEVLALAIVLEGVAR